jgi:hypothetical protein
MKQSQLDNYVKWLGTILTAVGVTLTAFDVTPLNKLVGILGSIGWIWAGWRMREPSLYLLNAFFIVLLLLGLLLTTKHF